MKSLHPMIQSFAPLGKALRRTISPTAAALLVLCGLLLLPGLAQRSWGQGQGDAMPGFLLTGEYQLLMDGKLQPKAEIFFNQQAVTLLVMSSELSTPVMLTQRTGRVASVHIMKVARREGGTVDLLQGATLAPLGTFRLDGTDVVVNVEGKELRLRPKGPLVGDQGRQDLVDHTPEYMRYAETYKPDSGTVLRLQRQKQDVQVKVYFGSWCSVCKRFLPHAIKVEEALQGSKIHFDYYGLPRPPEAWKDPEATKLGIQGVPTGIVYVNGKEAGRIVGGDWGQLERRIASLIKEASGA